MESYSIYLKIGFLGRTYNPSGTCFSLIGWNCHMTTSVPRRLSCFVSSLIGKDFLDSQSLLHLLAHESLCHMVTWVVVSTCHCHMVSGHRGWWVRAGPSRGPVERILSHEACVWIRKGLRWRCWCIYRNSSGICVYPSQASGFRVHLLRLNTACPWPWL
jgi:hypothetical protein